MQSIPDLTGGASAALTRTLETTCGFSATVIDCSTLSHLYSCLKEITQNLPNRLKASIIKKKENIYSKIHGFEAFRKLSQK